jgi:predicted Rossmann fold flavoprotein
MLVSFVAVIPFVIYAEKNNLLGRKLLMTGDGRCNLTHANLTDRELASSYGKQGDFLLSPLSRFGVEETMQFFEAAGLPLKIEDSGKVFPKSDKAQDVLQVLLKKLKENKVSILTNSEVIKIDKSGKSIKGITLADGEKLSAQKYILTVGGKAYPITGSTGEGFSWLQKMGHTIIKPRAALVPVQVKENWLKNLPGLSFKDVKVSILSNGKLIKKAEGDILFAHFGLTGPLILDLSRTIGDSLLANKTKILIDLFPHKAQEELEAALQKLIEKKAKKELKNILSDLVPIKFAPYVIFFAGLKESMIGSEINKEAREKLVKILKHIEFNAVSLVGFDRAMATAGGVSLKEIDNKTMQSKLIDNLYFAGEIIDLDGPCGGYNLQMCWTTGYIAGQK